MKIRGFFAYFLAGMFTFSSSAYAATSANQVVTGTIPVINSIATNGGTSAADISATNGQLSTTINPGFQSFTNNTNGVKVEFTIKATNSSNTSVDAMKGNNNQNTGTVILANTTVAPTSAAITDALSNNPSVASNANVIGYKLTLTGTKGSTSYNPVFDNTGAKASITAPVGTTNFIVQIANDSTILTNTYSSDYDLAGAYQSTIYCTVSNP